MKTTCMILCAVAMIGAAADSGRADVVWKGITWNPYDGASLVVADGNLEVTPGDGKVYGAAHYNTPTSFRNAPGHWVEVTFTDCAVDDGGGQIWMEDEGYTDGAGLWTQMGSWTGNSVYRIYKWDTDADWADGTWDYDTTAWLDLSSRSPTSHVLKLGKRSDGRIDYWLDGVYQHTSTTAETCDYMGDIYLAARTSKIIFTDYQTGTGYVAVAEPGAMALAGLAALVLLILRRRAQGV